MADLSELKRALDERGRWDGLEGAQLRFAALSLAGALEEAFHFFFYNKRSITTLRGTIEDLPVTVTPDQIEALWRDMIYRDPDGNIIKPRDAAAS